MFVRDRKGTTLQFESSIPLQTRIQREKYGIQKQKQMYLMSRKLHKCKVIYFQNPSFIWPRVSLTLKCLITKASTIDLVGVPLTVNRQVKGKINWPNLLLLKHHCHFRLWDTSKHKNNSKCSNVTSTNFPQQTQHSHFSHTSPAEETILVFYLDFTKQYATVERKTHFFFHLISIHSYTQHS